MKSFLWQTKPRQLPLMITRQPELIFRWHHHDYWEIFGVVSGSGQALIGDSHHQLNPGEVYVVGPNLPHVFFAIPEPDSIRVSGDFFIFTVDLKQIEPLFDETVLSRWTHAGSGGLRYSSAAAGAIIRQFKHAEKQTGLSHSIAALKILETLMNETPPAPLTQLRFPENLRRNNPDRIQSILKTIHERYAEPLTLAGIAASAGISEKTLSRIFRQSTGQSVLGYINRLRVSVACRQLISTGSPVTQIAFDCGFGSLSSFNRVFLHYENLTPSEYRQQKQTR